MEPPQPPSQPVPREGEPCPDEGERRLVDRLLAFRGPPPPWLTLDAGHDCAVVDGRLALTADTLVEGVHFDDKLAPEDVGFKTVAVSVSDLAAVRAQPRWMMLALSIGPRPGLDAWVEAFSRGLALACRTFGVYLVGGDTTRVPTLGPSSDPSRGPSPGPAFVSATLGGVCLGAPRARSGAAPDDLVWVTGWPGLAAAGYLQDHPPEPALSALRRPMPPLSFALALEEATAAMDLSDGLASDLPRLARASGVGIVLDEAAVPVHPALQGMGLQGPPPELRRQAVLAGGDDYALLFTTAASAADRVRALAEMHGVKVTPIGQVVAAAEPGARLKEGAWPKPAFSHFDGGGAA